MAAMCLFYLTYIFRDYCVRFIREVELSSAPPEGSKYTFVDFWEDADECDEPVLLTEVSYSINREVYDCILQPRDLRCGNCANGKPCEGNEDCLDLVSSATISQGLAKPASEVFIEGAVFNGWEVYSLKKNPVLGTTYDELADLVFSQLESTSGRSER